MKKVFVIALIILATGCIPVFSQVKLTRGENIKYFLEEGGVRNDSGADNSSALNSLIADLSSRNGGIIIFDTGSYYFKGSVRMKTNVTLSAVRSGTPTGDNKNVNLYHNPTVPETNFIEYDDPGPYWGFYNVNTTIEGLTLNGSSDSHVGIYLKNIYRCNVKDVYIRGFDENIIIVGAMVSRFTNVHSFESRIAGLHIVKPDTLGVNTSTVFDQCYFGHTTDTSALDDNSRPIIIDQSSTYGFDFYSCLIESADKGVWIGSENYLNFHNLLTENIPNDSIAIAVIEIGKDIPLSKASWGVYTFIGGHLTGRNGNTPIGTAIIDVDYCSALKFEGVVFARADSLITVSDTVSYEAIKRSRGISFNSCNYVQITSGLPECNKLSNFSMVGNTYGNDIADIADHVKEFTMGYPGFPSKTTISAVYSSTPGDLMIKAPDGNTTFAMDANHNIHLFGFSNRMAGTSGGGGLLIKPTNPTVGAADPDACVLYGVELDTTIVPAAIRSDKTKAPLMMGLSTNIGARPIRGLFSGLQYFDTTYRRPLYWHDSIWYNPLRNIDSSNIESLGIGLTNPTYKFQIAGKKTAPLAISTDNDGSLGDSTAIVINGAGKVGIGTTSPDSTLTVAGNGHFTGNVKVDEKLTVGNDLKIAATKLLYLDSGGNTYLTETSSDNIDIFTNGTQRIRFTSGGNFLINSNTPFGTMGSTSPAFYLINDAAVYGASTNGVWIDAYGVGATLMQRSACGTKASPTALTDNYVMSGIASRGYDGSAWSNNHGQMGMFADGTWTGSSHGVYMTVKLTASGSTASPTERFRVNSAGVGILTAGNPTRALDVNSDVIRVRTAKTPSSATDTGNAGDICWDANYIYICTATNTWKRAVIATW